HATLLLLGIYEDCGSLTYGNTTPRDARAAAWLLERGAHLDILRNFLNYPLTPAQQELYNAVVTQIESHTVHGNQIIISAVRTAERVPEISSIAHRLRELYDSDGLFLLVELAEDDDSFVQLVARSTTDAIHVGHIAEQFGGGGHPRAAAAHITNTSLADARNQLLSLLEALARPAATVRQIMSFTVRTLSVDQTIREANQMVTRYGYEGYPVVNEGRIAGILTRREIDKALRHQLGNASVSQFMQQGEIFVSPDDTVETLQQVMLREQVGQVPVVENGQIIGIVTRTDLISLWGENTRPRSRLPNQADRLETRLPTPLFNLLQEAGQAAATLESSLYLVGGFVRDLLLEHPGLDIDLVVEGDAIALGQAIQAKYGGHLHTHQRFGTANWITEDSVPGIDRLDFVTARTEFYHHPTALPEVEQSSIKQDLHRRDFTINTLAICLNPDRFGQLLDFYNGYNDLKVGRIRVLHSLSFVEDPTRILRAIRFEQRLGFQLGRRTQEHLTNALDLLPRVTPSRIFSEIEYICKEDEPERTFRRLGELGVLETIQPGLAAPPALVSRSQALRSGRTGTPWAEIEPDVVHYLGLLTFDLSPEQAHGFSQRLRIRSALTMPLRQVQTIKTRVIDLQQAQTPSKVYTLLAPFGEDALFICWLAFDDSSLKEALRHFSRTLRHIQPAIDGHYLIEHFNLRPSPLFQQILTMLRNARLDEQVRTPDEEHQMVEQFLAERKERED
ncbi:MAG TPA: CBS domain-containing protein, partial [Anaerolineae bacterium]